MGLTKRIFVDDDYKNASLVYYFSMYIQVRQVDHLQPLHKTSGSGIIAYGFAKRSAETPLLEFWGTRYSTIPYREWGFWRIGCAETPLPEFLRIPFAETPLVEFLRIPLFSDTPPTFRGFWPIICAKMPLLRIPCTETLLVEFLRNLVILACCMLFYAFFRTSCFL